MPTGPFTSPRRIVGLLLALVGLAASARAATLPPNFREVLIANGLANPTAMQFAPDGRLFICEQAGRVRVVKNGALLPTPFVTVTTTPSGERGLLGIAFDPAFASNHFVYVYYTATTPTVHNRISRFTANGDVAVAGSEQIIFELDNLSGATNHNGGALAFGPDGKLYAAVGENANGANAQSFNNVLGKMLRINSDGTIPSDNPFVATTTGKNQAIWALGLRNPFTFAFNPVGTEMFINDVGQNTWEEIDDGIAGSNYGWPETEGATTDPRFRSPIYTYNHASGTCAITGGAFYAPLTTQFPSDYVRDYFFADFCGGWIRKLDPGAGYTVANFASGISAPVDLKVSDDGSLYYLARGSAGNTGVVYRIEYTPPSSGGATATFVRTDTTTRGSWRGVYGTQGAALAMETSTLPAYAQLTLAGQSSYQWNGSTTDVRALQRPTGNDRFAATWYSGSTFSLDLNLTDGAPHQIALYGLDWDGGGRAERIDVLDATTNAVLDSRTLTQFGGGQYLVWTIAGHVVFRVTLTGGLNPIISGLFVDGGSTPPPPPPPGGSASASFVRNDAATRGSWRGVYGSAGASLATLPSTLPAYAQLTLSGQSVYTWNGSTTDVRALQRPTGSDRFAATWYAGSTFSLDLNLTDGASHQIALYAVDWDGGNRSERIEVLDASTGAVLDTRTLSQFVNGQYLIWTVKGHVVFRVTLTGGLNPILSALFVD